MLLVVDVGNTNIVLGVYKKKELVGHWRISTDRVRTTDEYGVLLMNLFFHDRQVNINDIEAIIISSVVPPLMPTLERVCLRYFNVKPIIVGPGTKTGMAIKYDNPRAILANGDYIGGAISPGVQISAEALFQRAAKLPRIEVKNPGQVICKSTVTSMQSGVLFGYVGQVEGIVARMKKEMPEGVKVIATGGLAHLIDAETDVIDYIEPMLTLEGLRLLYERNK